MATSERPTVPPTHRELALLLRPLVLRLIARTTSMLALLTAAYYVWPSRSPASDRASALRLTAALVSIALVAVVARAEVRALRRGPRGLTAIESLLTFFYFLVVMFAGVYYGIASTTDQFAGLESKTDGLYFTVTVVATVGFGDIHAVGTAARALVTIQMLFSILYIGTAFRVLSSLSSRGLPLPRGEQRPEP